MPCNPDGYTIGDGILFHLAEDELLIIGAPLAPNWVQYNAETGDYNVSVERDGNSLERDGPPKTFRYQVQGPNASSVMEDVVEGPLPDIQFFNFDQLSISGRSLQALRHSMSGEAGFEIWGDYEYADEVKRAILEAGQEYGMRRAGTRAYRSSAPMSGWIEFQLPAIYDGESMAGYREWLSSESLEANCSIGGSFYSDDITDYYLSPVDLGHEGRIDFDHDFVGKEALREMVGNPERAKVSLFWDSGDVVDVYSSLFREGETFKFIDLLDPIWSVAHYDEVRRDGETIGVSKWPTYNYNERAMLSLACVDIEHSEPGTEITLIWGEPNSTRPEVERHTEKEIQATIGPSPPAGDRR
jgi:glycine cleavage system aminomethyltransferase T